MNFLETLQKLTVFSILMESNSPGRNVSEDQEEFEDELVKNFKKLKEELFNINI